jgi:SSS family solute:Na+ symporter
VNASRIATLFLVVAAAIVSVELKSVSDGWKIVLELGAGTGGVYLLRWYWWRVNAWSEIAAMVAALVSTLTLRTSWVWMLLTGKPQLFHGSDPVVFAKTTLCTTGITTLVWLAVTFLTPAEPGTTLVEFYRKVKPDVFGWGPVAKVSGIEGVTRDLKKNLLNWALGCIFVYTALYSIGQFCFGRMQSGVILGVICAACGVAIYYMLPTSAEWHAD